jgi:hypothetical protein
MDFPEERKHLSSDGLVRLVREVFRAVRDVRKEPQIALGDALLAGFAIFALKSASLLAFENERKHNTFNLRALFGMQDIPSDTQLRAILDQVDPQELRPAFTGIFRELQRGKALEPFVFYNGHYLMAADGTEYFSSEKIHCDACQEKRSRNGVVKYCHQMLGMVLVHPDQKVVIPLCPEPIVRQDGLKKNDGERSATRRALEHFRREHPLLKVIEDALSANAPHLDDLKRFNIRYLIGIKPGSHVHLFEQMQRAALEQRAQTHMLEDHGTVHKFRWLADAELNLSHPDHQVTMLEYWETSPTGPPRQFSWITDQTVTAENVFLLMRGGRARWQIENETFNTLKNQGYHFEHNFGHGEQHLSVVMALLMMLAFLVDQVQQLCDPVFQALLKNMKQKCRLWQRIRGTFECFHLTSFRQLHEFLLHFTHAQPLPNTS